MHVEVRDEASRLRQLARTEKNAKLAQRLRLVAFAIEGHTSLEIGRWVDLSQRQVQHWVRHYNQGGVDGLKDQPGRGPSPMLAAEEVEQLKVRIDAGPASEDGVCTLRGKQVQRILKEESGKIRKLGAVYKLLHKIGYSSLAPRPQHRHADPAAQEAFKKTCRRSSNAFVANIQSSECNSSFKTKFALVSKAR
jgi:transposase